MRLEIGFSRPLDHELRTRLLIAVAGLAKSQRIAIARDGWSAVVRGEAMGVKRIGAALDEAGVPVDRLQSSLDAEQQDLVEESLDDIKASRERFRPIGR